MAVYLLLNGDCPYLEMTETLGTDEFRMST